MRIELDVIIVRSFIKSIGGKLCSLVASSCSRLAAFMDDARRDAHDVSSAITQSDFERKGSRVKILRIVRTRNALRSSPTEQSCIKSMHKRV